MSIAVTAADLRQLLDSPAESPVLYLKHGPDDEGGEWMLDVWAGAYVHDSRVVITRSDLIDDVTGDSPDDDEIRDAVDTVQGYADETAESLT
ncbi:hypothetical protein ABZX85_23475 [Streptomyces sp. NPDC004539]|uniref:hypothetical protein n=1 Tax=Streptomyces sp. NPDC004539 TaxID=3154280 RepID=UPI00339DA918